MALEALVATVLIGVVPIAILLPLPTLCKTHDSKRKRSALNLLLCFAAGGLLGDSFLHLIPHALQPHHHHHNHAGEHLLVHHDHDHDHHQGHMDGHHHDHHHDHHDHHDHHGHM
mmetsp:Transcript_21977/g.42763  ORF Transcript_21977/g.42763 Transcript_21977/m.42763 type:complete len:114 (+) Transcript_21977:29-370(+)